MEIKNHSYFRDMSCDQAVVYLKSIYATIQEKTPICCCHTTVVHDALIKVSDRELITQSIYSYNSSLESLLDFLFDSNSIEFLVDQVQNESDADYMARLSEHVRNILRQFCLCMFWRKKLTNTVNQKASM